MSGGENAKQGRRAHRSTLKNRQVAANMMSAGTLPSMEQIMQQMMQQMIEGMMEQMRQTLTRQFLNDAGTGTAGASANISPDAAQGNISGNAQTTLTTGTKGSSGGKGKATPATAGKKRAAESEDDADDDTAGPSSSAKGNAKAGRRRKA